ncbi:NucA/NucB deoxyribonuclease domain-containing protein [Streptomyces sp. AM8-1-1]|uniref:NucA/NucB deoxyribonuclease domain-containing protein n=1 Tax=Streptomyces sp. AM8-1-1 TaxID=3075825 RepID=UPI0028C3F5D3|nr:NucA/NucB deoxyribonuclease domain-containing protein [Streptomyces sp. AM8-1-1]WNO76920.1 NucA/NucB deoxyribonuclease domain-containing protein [Streptomyces sp. AM8-1-1]
MESFVLPVGAVKPSLKDLQSGSGMQRLRDLVAQTEPGARLPRETVGPAASYAPLSHRTSGMAPEQSAPAVRALLGPSATAPEPARTMTYGECVKGLGSEKSFFVKSRFAVCNGASFLQTWTRNNRPVGESMFNVRVIGTIAKNSRDINFQYDFTDFTTTGTTGAATMPITTKGNIPQSWPAGAKYVRGGKMPGTKTFTQLKAQRTFNETVTAKPGQGSKKDLDLLFAVYEPVISYTPPPGWTLRGALGGKLFMLAPRWDSASYLANSTGGTKPEKKGAATFSYLTTLTLSAKPGAEEQAEAAHIRQTFLVPQDTKPYMSAKKVPGQTAKEPLHRTVDSKRIDKNRAAAVKQCKRYWGPNYTSGDKECDEYPFASTYEGAAESEYDPEVTKFNFSAKPIPKADNQAGGQILKSYYGKNRIIDGLDDGFMVTIVS